MIEFSKVRWTLVAVIFITICVQWISCRAAYLGPGLRGRAYSPDEVIGGREPTVEVGKERNAVADGVNHKHLLALKAPNPSVVEKVRKRMRARMRGRKPNQSNERYVWRSHPKNENWSGPDTEEVYEVFTSLGM